MQNVAYHYCVAVKAESSIWVYQCLPVLETVLTRQDVIALTTMCETVVLCMIVHRLQDSLRLQTILRA